jgi:hypothetical protein
MALQGSLADFNILNILQMVKLEGKTGKLTLSQGEDLVKITFDSGSIIYAESRPEADESRIMRTMLAHKMISPEVWAQIKKEHDDKLKPYWEILSKNAGAQKIVLELLRRQTVDNVYFALRWKKGNYEFDVMKTIKYNNKVMTPMDVDALLMEGCRLADEMPDILRSLPKLDTFIIKNIIGEDDMDKSSVDAKVVTGPAWNTSLEREILNARSVELNNADMSTLSVIGAGATIQEIMDAARQGNFESVDALKRLLDQGIVKTSKKKEIKAAGGGAGTVAFLVAAAVLAVIVLGGGFWRITILQPAAAMSQKETINKVRTIDAQIGLKKVIHGLKVFTSYNGAPPDSLRELASAKILSPADIVDPWGNPYKLVVSGDKYALYSSGPDLFLPSDDLFLTKKKPVADTASEPAGKQGKKKQRRTKKNQK